LDYWSDYPGFEVDEEAIYITNNLFLHPPFGGFGGTRLWIIDKGVVGGFYSGGAAIVTKHDPYAGTGTPTTTMPALVYGAGGVGVGIGTFLVSYSGLTDGTNEYIQIVRVNNPLGAVSFTHNGYFNLGDIENASGTMPDAPQSGGVELIETNDRRALDAVWRNNYLWFTTQIVPPSGPDVGQATAHWFKFNTSTWPPTLADNGNIGGEDIASNTFTFFPSVAVNNAGDAKFGFSASASSIFAGAYVAGREAGDAAGTVQATETVRTGVAYYVRTFDGPPCSTTPARNRWGDYSGISLDPTDDNIFWVFNEYAAATGTGTTGGCNGRPNPEVGRWGTAWASTSFEVTDFTNGADDELNFTQSSPSPPITNWPLGQFSLRSYTNQATFNSITISLNGTYSGLDGANPFRLLANNTNNYSTAAEIGSDAAESGGSVTFNSLNDALPYGFRYFWVTVDLSASASGTINGTVTNSGALNITNANIIVASSYGLLNSGTDVPLPVELSSFTAKVIRNGGVQLNWTTETEVDNYGFDIERAESKNGVKNGGLNFNKIDFIEGHGNSNSPKEYSYTDQYADYGNYAYRLKQIDTDGSFEYSDIIEVEAGNIPEGFVLEQNYPNPFNPTTSIKFALAETQQVELKVFDVLGNEIATLFNGIADGGKVYEAEFKAANLSSGIYFYRLETERKVENRKMLLIK
jgi:hypothetical protein